jgi:hypothetical protein
MKQESVALLLINIHIINGSGKLRQHNTMLVEFFGSYILSCFFLTSLPLFLFPHNSLLPFFLLSFLLSMFASLPSGSPSSFFLIFFLSLPFSFIPFRSSSFLVCLFSCIFLYLSLCFPVLFLGCLPPSPSSWFFFKSLL